MKSILIVDDEKEIREVMREILERQGYNVLVASNGNEAIKKFKEQNPVMVVTDLLMPGKDGIETLFELRQMDCNTKIVALSGGGRISPENYLNYAMKLGAAAILEKPFTTNEFLSVIRQTMAID